MIIVYLAVAIFIFIFAYMTVNWYLNAKAPEERTEAVLIQKKSHTSVNANNVMTTSYTMYFNVNGNTIKFNVDHKTYKQFYEGQKGILVYKRKRFIDFIL